uniref:Uncharacterized protein n=1 Tax=Oryza nivara TaxID=4536 RepID=A0A0E0IHJ1_ORYNI
MRGGRMSLVGAAMLALLYVVASFQGASGATSGGPPSSSGARTPTSGGSPGGSGTRSSAASTSSARAGSTPAGVRGSPAGAGGSPGGGSGSTPARGGRSFAGGGSADDGDDGTGISSSGGRMLSRSYDVEHFVIYFMLVVLAAF